MQAVAISKKSCDDSWLKKASSLLFKEWVLTDYGRNHNDWNKRREDIMKLETIAERFSDANGKPKHLAVAANNSWASLAREPLLKSTMTASS